MATYDSNFNKFKSDFKVDTKLEADANMALYIQYVNARLADINFQLMAQLKQTLELKRG